MVRWMCGIKLKDRLPRKELRERLGKDDSIGFAAEVHGPRPRGRPKRTWREVVREDCPAHKTGREDAMDRCGWRRMIKGVR